MNITKSPSLQLLRKLHYQFSGLNDVSISSEDDWDSVTTVVHRNSGWFSARTSRCSSIMSLTFDWDETSRRERERSLRNALKVDTLEEPNYKFGLNAFLSSDCQNSAKPPAAASGPRANRGLESPGSNLESPLSPSLDYRVSVGALLSAGLQEAVEDSAAQPESTESPRRINVGLESLKLADPNVKSPASSLTASPRLITRESCVREHDSQITEATSDLSSGLNSLRISESPFREQRKSPQLHVECKQSESEASDDVSSSAVADTKSSGSDERYKPSERELKDASKKIFVSNFSQNTSKNVLWKFFAQYAKVCDVYLVKDYRTRKSRCRAFVQFLTAEDAKRVLGLERSELYLNGRTLFIEAARPKQPKNAQPFVNVSSNYDQKLHVSPQPPPPSASPTNLTGTVTINALPIELMQKIFSYLTIQERVAAERVCKHWRFLGTEARWSLKHLSFANTFNLYRPLNDYVFKSILKRTGITLASLDIGKCGESLTYKSVEIMLNYCPNLEIVNLSTMPVTNMGLRMLSTVCPKIRKATMQKCSFGEKGLWWLLKNCDDLEYIDVSNNDRIKGLCFHVITKRIRSMILANCSKLMPKGIFELKRCTDIRELILSNCIELDNSALQFVFDYFTNSLKKLHVDGPLPKVDFRCISCKPMPNFEDLSLADNESVDDSIIQQMVKNCPNINILNISGTTVSNQGLIHLMDCQRLHEVNVSHLKEANSFGIQKLAEAGRLRKIVIKGWNLSNYNCLSLALNCKELSYLDISSCTDVGDYAVTTWLDLIELEERKTHFQVVAGGTLITRFMDTPTLSISSVNTCPVHLRPQNFPDLSPDMAAADYDELDADDGYPDDFEERLAAYEMLS